MEKAFATHPFFVKSQYGDQTTTTRHQFNYVMQKYTWSKFLNDKKIKTRVNKIPVYKSFHDILTMFYNVRKGSYSPLTKGNHFKIKTITEKVHDEISAYIPSEEEVLRAAE
jgi:hypothetical protein